MKKDFVFKIPELNELLLESKSLEVTSNLRVKADGLNVLIIKDLNEKEYSVFEKLSKMVLEDFKSTMASNTILPINNTYLYKSIFKAYTDTLNELGLTEKLEVSLLSEINFDFNEAKHFDNENNDMKKSNPNNFKNIDQTLTDGMEI